MRVEGIGAALGVSLGAVLGVLDSAPTRLGNSRARSATLDPSAKLGAKRAKARKAQGAARKITRQRRGRS